MGFDPITSTHKIGSPNNYAQFLLLWYCIRKKKYYCFCCRCYRGIFVGCNSECQMWFYHKRWTGLRWNFAGRFLCFEFFYMSKINNTHITVFEKNEKWMKVTILIFSKLMYYIGLKFTRFLYHNIMHFQSKNHKNLDFGLWDIFSLISAFFLYNLCFYSL